MRPCIEMTYPEFSGCYALLRDGTVVYVGKSINVFTRLSNHRNRLRRMLANKGDYSGQSKVIVVFDSVRLYPCPMRELDRLERELILLYNPFHNVQVPRPAKVIDIAALAARANVDLGRWRRTDTRSYSTRLSKGYRRVA